MYHTTNLNMYKNKQNNKYYINQREKKNYKIYINK